MLVSPNPELDCPGTCCHTKDGCTIASTVVARPTETCGWYVDSVVESKRAREKPFSISTLAAPCVPVSSVCSGCAAKVADDQVSTATGSSKRARTAKRVPSLYGRT